MSDDGYIDHAKLQQRYLVHYDTGSGSRFGIDVWSTLRQAEADADGFREDGMQARVIKVTVENGGVVAQWCTGVDEPRREARPVSPRCGGGGER